MPVPEVDRLSPQSEEAQVRAAISACIAQEVAAGRDRDQAIAMCHQMVSAQTQRDLARPPKPPTEG